MNIQKFLWPPLSFNEFLSLLEQIESLLLQVEQFYAHIPFYIYHNCGLRWAITTSRFCYTSRSLSLPLWNIIMYHDTRYLLFSSFAYFTNTSTSLYTNGVRILEIMVNVRYCIVMLNLDSQYMIFDTFQHFLSALQEAHLGNIFTYIETIMTFIWEKMTISI